MLQLIDADAHIVEPADLWVGDFMDPAYRDKGPAISLADGHVYYPGGEPFPWPACWFGAGSLGSERGAEPASYRGDRPGGYDPDARIDDLDLDGIDAAFLYPTVCLIMGHVEDLGLAAAMARAYNRWMADWTSSHPDRLFGVALLPMEPRDAVEELRYARNELGFKAAMLRPHVYRGRVIHSPEWDPVWAEAEELDCAIAFHGGLAWPTPQAGEDRFFGDQQETIHVVIHPFEQQLAMVGLIQTGVFDRFPKLRVGFMESGGSWVVSVIERLERHHEQTFHFADRNRPRLTPREYFDQNCWISFEPVERSLGLLADYIGPHKILWATDYPHPDGFFPGAPKLLEENLQDCTEETKRAVRAEGARAFYGI